MAGKGFFDLLGQECDVGARVAILIGDLEAAAEVDELQLRESRDQVEEDADALYKDIDIADLATGMDMQVGNMEVIFIDELEDLVDLLDGDAELALVMTGRDLEVAACHDVGAEPDADRIGMTEFLAKLFKVRKAVDIDDDAQRPGLFDLFKGDAIGGVEDAFFGEAGMEGQPDLVYAAAVDIGAEAADVF